MDQELMDLVWGDREAVPGTKVTTELRFPEPGVVSVGPQDNPRLHTLKPLRELFGEGNDAGTVDPLDPHYERLFLTIERKIVRRWQSDLRLTDAAVLLALEKLAMQPEAEYAQSLEADIQLELRLLLSLEDYSRQEVRAALRKIAKSVNRHTRLEGPMGYLIFIRAHVPV